ADAGNLPWKNGAFDVVVMRHVLEHLPRALMQQTLLEAMRVSARAVLLDFYVPPIAAGDARTARVGEGFLESRWATTDIESPIASTGWSVRERRTVGRGDEVWVLARPTLDPLFLSRDPDRAALDEPF